MRRKYIQERASVLNTAGANSGKPFVVSAAAPKLPTVETASFGCKSCSAEFASAKGSEPFCINCGSDDVSSIQAAAQAVPETDKSLAAILCKSCGTHNVFTEQTASVLDGQMHCVECGGQLSYDVDELNQPVTDATEDSITQTLDVQEADTNSAEDRGGQTDGSPLNDVSEQDVNDTLPTTVEAEAPEANQVPAVPENGNQSPEQPEAPVVEPVIDTVEDETLIEHAEWEQDEQEDGCNYSDTSLAAVVLSSNPKAKLTLATAEDEILAFADGVHIARLEKANAGEHAAVFHSKSFMQAIARVADAEGIRAAMSKFGFAGVRVKFPMTAAARAVATASLSAEKAKLEAATASHKTDMLQCVSLASVALTKGLFKTKGNALRAGFVQMLTTAGVKNPGVMVDRVFAANADAYHKQLFEMAVDLMGKPLDYRNTLAESLGDMNALSQELDMPNDEGQDVVVEHADALALQMESAALRGRRSPVTAAAGAAPAGSISQIRAAAGGALFAK